MVPHLSALYHLSPIQMAILAAVIIAALVPSIFILRRRGFSGWWAIIAPISPLNLIGLWVLAFTKWPVED